MEIGLNTGPKFRSIKIEAFLTEEGLIFYNQLNKKEQKKVYLEILDDLNAFRGFTWLSMDEMETFGEIVDTAFEHRYKENELKEILDENRN